MILGSHAGFLHYPWLFPFCSPESYPRVPKPSILYQSRAEVECGKSKSGGGSRVHVSTSSGRSRIGRRSSSSHPYRLRSSLSRSRLPSMFPTRTALLGVFIAYPMRPTVHLHTYRDLERYTVCEGVRTVYDNGTMRNYSYFICPDSLSDRSLTYCCSNDSNGSAQFCCTSDGWRNIVGGVLGTAMGLVGFGLLVYCCCCRNRVKQPHHSLHSVTNVGVARVDSSDSSSSPFHARNQPTCPYPIPTSTDVPPPYPVDPKMPAALSSIDAGCSDDTSTVSPPAAPVPRAETPPPPYPTDDTTTSVQPSAPDPP
ncbi:hypothetical protein AHF37_04008 [Paragonimus kellicotti]|nr:hypothetical protein AHF37_04008 [Paragonimus kellicotti]